MHRRFLRTIRVKRVTERHEREVAQRERPRWLRVLIWIALGGAALLLTGIVAGVVTLLVLLKDLPSADELASVTFAQSTRILDRDGKLLYEIHGDERRTIVALDAMSYVPRAVIAAEDDSFYEHPGFDVAGLTRAAIAYARRAVTGSGVVQGGSTITQQFVKNTYLSTEKTFTRKAKELILAMEVEQRFSKDEILALYLNVVGFGSNAYGVESAARMYFAKGAKDLTLDESAMLAGMLQSPSRLSPYGQNTDRLLKRKAYVLGRMLELGSIDEEQHDAALATDTLAKVRPTKESIRAPHFVFFVRDELEQRYGREVVERGGLTVTTTLDPRLQSLAETKVADLVRRRGEQDKVTNSALVSLDPRSGAVLAMAGSKGYFAEDVDGKVNVTTSRRQPGSSFKPFIYARFFEQGYGPGSVLWDVETDFGHDYKPKNFSGTFTGPITVRKALGGSLNIPVIKAMYVAGMMETVDYVARTFGFASIAETPRDAIGLSFAIGAVEVTPLEMAQGYGVFATNGAFHRATSITRVVDANGTVLEDVVTSDPGTQVLDPQVAYQVTDILSDCAARPAGWGALCYEREGRTVAAKTGTSNRKVKEVFYPSDLWTVAYTPSLVTTMWAGNNDGSVTALRADGLNTVAPIMKEYVLDALKTLGTEREEFTKPSGITTITLSNLSGFPGGSAEGGVHTDIISSFGKEKLSTFRAEAVQTAQVDESCGPALASEYSPPEAVKTYVYANVHDLLWYIRPNDPLVPAFDGPIRRFEGLSGGEGSTVVFVTNPDKIPKEVCAKYTSASVPQISLVRPSGGVLSIGANTVEVDIAAFNPIRRVEFRFDGVGFAETSACSRCAATLMIPDGTTGDHTLEVVAEDEFGFTGQYQARLTVSTADTTPPSVKILSPPNQTRVSPGSVISVEADVADASSVEFALDRVLITTLTSAPYAASMRIPDDASGTVEVAVIARDDAGNIATDSIRLEVLPPEPVTP